MALFTSGAAASVIGHLSVTNCRGGGVTVGLASIDCLPGGLGTSACLQLGVGTTITSVGDGNLFPTSDPGTINDLPPLSGIDGFMSFIGPGTNLQFDLAPIGGFGPGLLISCATSPAVGFACSVPGSPFVLNTTFTGTSVLLLAHGTIVDSGDGASSNWGGAFTTQINGQTPAQIQATILDGRTVTS